MPIANRSSASFDWLTKLRRERAIAVIRAPSLPQGLHMAAAVEQAGLRLIEITWNSEQPEWLVETLRDRYPHCDIGVGTILSKDELRAAIAAGAQFACCPHVDPALIEIAKAANCPIVPGALSPTEILTAWNAGADGVKVFPADLGGARYIHNLQGPLGHIPYIPTGGISADTAAAYLEAGAIAIGVASCLFQAKFLKQQDWPGLTAHIQAFKQQLDGHRL
ncbi:MAG: bifunctional 4-hydroxy-2-oxoglutarate aldolase/2-dehydro-3-deoxy-phosphogluconate aldolase [Cyanobacteria bacterium P01_F01_bin.42]